jgi:hypothetical protein
MSKTAKIADTDRARIAPATGTRTAAAKAAEGDVLHFLSRTLQAHFLDAEPRDILVKLRTLRKALDQQEITLSRWPDSPSKARICAALAKAKNLVTQIADEYGIPADRRAAAGGDEMA